jgi:hypothetical protein
MSDTTDSHRLLWIGISAVLCEQFSLARGSDSTSAGHGELELIEKGLETRRTKSSSLGFRTVSAVETVYRVFS